VSSQPIQLISKPQETDERQKLIRRAKLLAWLGVGWHGIEAAVAVGAGLAASSIALIGFGTDSLIESVAGSAQKDCCDDDCCGPDSPGCFEQALGWHRRAAATRLQPHRAGTG
jgi:hypothetical protein